MQEALLRTAGLKTGVLSDFIESVVGVQLDSRTATFGNTTS